MKRQVLACLLILSAGTAGTAVALPAATPRAVVQTFLDYLLHEHFENRFGLNQQGQFKYLSDRLRTLSRIAECDADRAYDADAGDYTHVDNNIVFDRWDVPSACTVVGTTQQPVSTTVEVDCTWTGKTDHRAGQHIQLFFTTIRQRGDWVIDNVAHGKQTDEATDAEQTKTDLISRLDEAGHQSAHPEICEKAHMPQPSAQ